MYKMILKDKVCLVTGGGKGIGNGICRSFAREGAYVAVNFSKSQREAQDLIEELGQQAIAIKADISKKEEVNRMVDEVISKFGKIDVLVNNAAFQPPFCSFIDLEEEVWERTINVNMKGVFLCSQRVAKEMIQRKINGKIINISSVCGLLSEKGLIIYSASKSGLNSMTKTMALELAPYGINVNSIAPGAIEVENTRDELRDNSNEWRSLIPVGRWGQPEDVGNLAVFLASDKANYICGEIIYMDGGHTIQLQEAGYDYEKYNKK